MKQLERTLLLLAAGAVIAAAVPAGSAPAPAATPAPILLPAGPAYLEFQKSLRAAGPFSGLMPGPHDAAAFRAALPFRAEGLPSFYDLRLTGKMTAVRSEGAAGGSAAYAALASMESFLKPLETWDFSETQLLSALGATVYLDGITAALARWSGPVREADGSVPAAAFEDPNAAKRVQKVVYLPPRADARDNDRLKQAVLDYGALYTEMDYADGCLNAAQGAYYNPGTPAPSRAVAIAGWDDDFDRTRFSPAAPANGAFLCKNSLGGNWASSGYFYVSYHDAFFARRSWSAAFTADPLSEATVNYQHDPNGCTARLGYDSETAWFAAVFIARGSDPLKAVSFFQFAPAADYEIALYLDPLPGQPRSGTPAASWKGSLDEAGYQTVLLPAPVAVFPNQRFSAVVKLTTPGDKSPIPIEYPLAGLTAAFSADPGTSFISLDGAAWQDLTGAGADFRSSDVCLKVFAGFPPVYPPAELRVERLQNNFYFFKEYVDRLTWQANPNNSSAAVRYRIYRREAGGAYQLLAETDSAQTSYYVRGLKKEDAAAYRVTAIMDDGRESDPAEVAL